MALWSPWGRRNWAPGGVTLQGRKEVNLGFSNSWISLINSYQRYQVLVWCSLRIARDGAALCWKQDLYLNFQLMMEATEINWNCLRFSLDLMSSMFFFLTAWSFPQLFGGPLLILLVDSPHIRWIFTQLPIKPRCTSISDKGLPPLSALWGEMTHFYQPRIAMAAVAPRRLIAVPLLSKPKPGPPGRVDSHGFQGSGWRYVEQRSSPSGLSVGHWPSALPQEVDGWAMSILGGDNMLGSMTSLNGVYEFLQRETLTVWNDH